MSHGGRNPTAGRPVIDLDPGSPHQYGYRRPDRIPSRPNERWHFTLLHPTRTPDQEDPTCSDTTPTD